MLIRLSPLLRTTVYADFESEWRVSDCLVDGDLRALRYLLLQANARPIDAVIPVPMSAVAEPRRGTSELSVGLSNDELRDLSDGAFGVELARADEARLHELIHWRPYWSFRDRDAEPDLHPLAQAEGMKALWRGEVVGTLRDVFVDAFDWSIRLVELTSAEDDVKGYALVPTGSIGAVDWTNGTMAVDAAPRRVGSARDHERRNALDVSEVGTVLYDS